MNYTSNLTKITCCFNTSVSCCTNEITAATPFSTWHKDGGVSSEVNIFIKHVSRELDGHTRTYIYLTSKLIYIHANIYTPVCENFT